MMVTDTIKHKAMYTDKLHQFFIEADTSGDGYMSFEEFQELLTHPKALTYMATLELDVHEAESLFLLLDDGDDKVSFDKFVQGIVRLKGQARSMDVIKLLHDSSR